MDKRKKKAKVSKLHKRSRAPGRRPRKPVSIPMSIDRVPNGIDLKSAKFAVDLLQAARERFEKDSESVWEALGHAADAMKEPIDEAEKWAEKLLDSFRWRTEATPDWEASTARATETVRILERCKADEGPPVVDAETELMRRALAEALEHEPLSDGSEPSFKDLIVRVRYQTEGRARDGEEIRRLRNELSSALTAKRNAEAKLAAFEPLINNRVDLAQELGFASAGEVTMHDIVDALITLPEKLQTTKGAWTVGQQAGRDEGALYCNGAWAGQMAKIGDAYTVADLLNNGKKPAERKDPPGSRMFPPLHEQFGREPRLIEEWMVKYSGFGAHLHASWSNPILELCRKLAETTDGAPTYEQLIAALRKLARYAHRGPSTGMVRMPTPSIGNAVFNEALALVEQYEKAVSPLRTVTSEPVVKGKTQGDMANSNVVEEIKALQKAIRPHAADDELGDIEARVEAIVRWLQQRFG